MERMTEAQIIEFNGGVFYALVKELKRQEEI